MQRLFRYNWQVREEWFETLAGLPQEELLKERTGGVRTILYTMYHIVDTEYSWLAALQGKPEPPEEYGRYDTLAKVRELSAAYRPSLISFLDSWTPEQDSRIFESERGGRTHRFSHGEVLHHAAAHEIHHIGQLSVWARELDLAPVNANLISRELT
ncbi:DinB family protein [Paenibacillus mucilaginosus]|uniref:DinB n=1 Tax=Paenibacillus mucilaginosus (strain KNP414) TaxID=1036673 RepID=F8FMH1_PAEMK|nr:DinB family protein [Paenibacillus mucilaginosus]AEI40054.1 hypothetical protein KNP414_01490 [Paenibacillus mucilaginosus KNP414]MCG7215661.1 DinB family protein [Paenibacillus mucilaginosus]WDM29294.1 DinB family protein [Paenibacillus mucilaginosus]